MTLFTRLPLLGLVSVAFSLVTSGAPSIAGEPNDVQSCSYDSSTHRVTFEATRPKEVRFRRQGNKIEYRWADGSYARCEGATVNNTDRIHFKDRTPQGGLRISLRLGSGGFAPGHTEEARGESEIEFRIDRPDTDNRRRDIDLWIYGSRKSDVVIGGSEGMEFNNDEDIDLRNVGPAERFAVVGRDGPDKIYADGRGGTGRMKTDVGGSRLEGGNGGDVLVGGPGNDYFLAAEGNDRLRGQRGHDTMWGWTGKDHIVGGLGPDFIHGEYDVDELEGSRGNDDIEGGSGDDHLDGDAGTDDCDGGPGKDSKEDCETGN